METNKLTDGALDWAVALSEGLVIHSIFGGHVFVCGNPESDFARRQGSSFQPSTNPDQGCQIIARELAPTGFSRAEYLAKIAGSYHGSAGQSRLVADMRRHVASKLGGEINIPEELCD
jgi:hypothetical protein